MPGGGFIRSFTVLYSLVTIITFSIISITILIIVSSSSISRRTHFSWFSRLHNTYNAVKHQHICLNNRRADLTSHLTYEYSSLCLQYAIEDPLCSRMYIKKPVWNAFYNCVFCMFFTVLHLYIRNNIDEFFQATNCNGTGNQTCKNQEKICWILTMKQLTLKWSETSNLIHYLKHTDSCKNEHKNAQQSLIGWS